jgi:FMN phosphatase YigB (HAD superfamily)
MTEWLVFDVGETLASEQRWLSSWADWLGVPTHTFFAALGAIIAAKRPYHHVFEQFRPGIDRDAEGALRRRAGIIDVLTRGDLYPDALPTLTWAHEVGYRIGVAGNTSAATEDFVRSLDLPADFIGSAERWGASKPDRAFFDRIVAEAGVPPAAITYIGDSIENDVLAPLRFGMRAVHVARGPWGAIHATWPEAKGVRRIATLAELPALLGRGG